MLGFSKNVKHEEILDIKRGDVFNINSDDLSKEANSKRSWFSSDPIDIIDFNEVIIVRSISSSVQVLPIMKTNRLMKYDAASIDDIRTIPKIYLEEKIGMVSELTLEKFKYGDHKVTQIEYQ